jgi:hypothetical protein
MSALSSQFMPRTALAVAALVVASALVMFTGVNQAQAVDEPGDAEFLGTAEDYVIIAAATITETSGSAVEGDVALYTGTDQQLLVGQVDGEIHVGTDAAGGIAMADATAAYNVVALAPVTSEVVANLAGGVYLAGVYHSAASLLLDGTMEIHGVTADDVFIFQASTEKLTVLAGSHIILTGLAQACNVYWQVGSSATIGSDSVFVGTVLAYSDIAAQTGATIEGRLIALTGEVTLDDNTIDSQTLCVRTAVAVTPTTTTTTTTTRENGVVTVDVVDTATPSVGEGPDVSPAGSVDRGTLASTGAGAVDYSTPLIVVTLLTLLGLGLVAGARVMPQRRND